MSKEAGLLKTAIGVLLALIALIFALRYDSAISFFLSGIQNNILNQILFVITLLGSTIMILFILTSVFMWHEHKRKWIPALWLSLLLSAITSIFFKVFIQRVRPMDIGFPTLARFYSSFSFWNTSFPSFHAAAAFSALPILDKEFPRFKFFWLGFAILVAFSRIYFNLHFLSDVIAGALLGYLIGLFFVRLEERYRMGMKLFKTKDHKRNK